MESRDLNSYTKGNRAIKPSRTYTHHSAIVNDVQHHPLHSSLIGTVSDDITVQIIDTRESDTTRSAASAEGLHKDAINSIAFNPASETVLATGSSDKTIGLWDLRNLKTKLHSLECHLEAVTSVAWHPFEESVLASASYDRRIMFWDLSRAGEEQSPEDAQDGPPELYVYDLISHLLDSLLIYRSLPGCSSMAATQIASRTSAGTSTIPGFFPLRPRITCCRSGRWPIPLWARISTMFPAKSWSYNRCKIRLAGGFMCNIIKTFYSFERALIL